MSSIAEFSEIKNLQEAILKGIHEAIKNADDKNCREVLMYKRAVLFNVESLFNILQKHAFRQGD